MRKPNVKFIAAFFGSLLALAVVTQLWHMVQIRRHASINLTRADELAEDRRYGEAIFYLQKYLRLNPNDDVAQEKLGELYLRSGGLKAAYLSFEAVARRSPRRVEVRRQLATLAVRMRRATDALEHLEPLLQDSPNDAELLQLRAQAFELVGTRAAEAREAYLSAIKADPHRIECYRRLADLMRDVVKDEAEADRTIVQMVAKNPGEAKAYRFRGEYYYDSNRLREASNDAKKALELAPDDPDCVSLAARCAADEKDNARAHELANRAIELAPNVAQSYILLAGIEGRIGTRADQRAALERGRAVLPDDALLTWNLAHLIVDDKDAPGAERLVSELRRMNYTPVLLAYLEARIKLAHGAWSAGTDLLESIRTGLSDWPELAYEADSWLAAGGERLGNPDLQMKALRSALRLRPTSYRAASQLAELLLQLGRTEQALQTYQNAAASPEAPPDAQGRVLQLMIFRNLSLRPERRDWRKIEAAIDQAESNNSDLPGIALLRAEVLVAQGKSKEGVSVLQKAVKKSPEELSLWTALIRLAERDRDFDRASQLLKTARGHIRDSLELLLLEGELAAYQRGAGAANTLASIEAELNTADSSERAPQLRELASLYEAIGEFGRARQLLEKLAEAEPQNLSLRLALFDLAKRANDDEAMKAAIGQIEQIEGTGRGVLFRYAAAVRKVMQFKELGKPALAEARLILREATTRRPGWPRLARLAAEIAELERDYSTAIEHYQQAINLGDRNQAVLRRLVELLYERRKFTEADQALRRLEEQQVPFSKQLGQMATHVSLELNDLGRAIDLAESTASSTDYRDQIWLGAVLNAANRVDEAEQAYRRAVELGEDVGSPWVALVQFLVARGRVEAADEAIAAARGKIVGNDRALALANCYESLNRPELAEQAYLEALAASDELSVLRAVADFYVRRQQIAKAEELLRRMVAKTDDAGADLDWARRNLGLMLGVERGFREFERGLALINKNLQSTEQRVEDLRAKAILLSAQPAFKFKQEGIKILEELAKRDSAASEDLFLLANLYSSSGRWSDAHRQLQSLLAVSPTADHIAFFVRSLLTHGVTRDADLWLAKLRQLEPDSAQMVELTVRNEFAKGDFTRAVERLREFASQGDSDDANAVRARLAARLSAELANQPQFASAIANRSDEDTRRQEEEQNRWQEGRRMMARAAEEHFQRCLAVNPNDPLEYCGFLASQNRVDEALKRFGMVRGQPAAAMVATAQAIVNSGHASPTQIGVVKSTLAGLPGANESAPLLTAMGDLENLLERLDSAENYYRLAIKSDRDFVLALNNLAVVLALRHRSVNEASLFIARAIEIAGPVAELLDSRAIVMLAAGDADNAIKDLQESLATNPSAVVYFHLAQAQLARGDAAAAKASYEQARKRRLTRDSLTALERGAFDKLTAALQL